MCRLTVLFIVCLVVQASAQAPQSESPSWDCQKPVTEPDYAEAAKAGHYEQRLLVFQLKRLETTYGGDTYSYCSSRIHKGTVSTVCSDLPSFSFTTGQDQIVVQTEEGFRYVMRCVKNCRKAVVVPGCWYTHLGNDGWVILEKHWTYDKKTQTSTPHFDTSTWSIYGSLGKESAE